MDTKMNLKSYLPRVVDKTLDAYLSVFGAVCVEGPKWCGKTWTSARHARSSFFVSDPTANFSNRLLAFISPSRALIGEAPRLIDEWQETPALWDAVRFEVDARNRKGQFILTSSSTPKRKGVLHGGAGRIGKLRMRTMSLYELGFSSGKISLRDLCNGNFDAGIIEETSIDQIIDWVIRGGWPNNKDTDIDNASFLPNSFISSLLEDDSDTSIAYRLNKHKMELLLRSLARNECTCVGNATLLRDISEKDDGAIDLNTLKTYIDVFERMYLLDNQLPFADKIRSSTRVKISEKRHFCDVSLASALLKATPDKLLHDLNTLGFLFESLCEHDLKVYAESFGASVYHYQDYKGNEIDAVIELKDGAWCAYEIKLGCDAVEEAASKLLKIKGNIEKEGGLAPSFCCVIVGVGNTAYRRDDGVYVVPLAALKD